jgi:hypothetical protein
VKIQEIRAKAKALQVKNTFGLSKAELIRRIQRAEGNFDCFGTAKGYCEQFQFSFREDSLRRSGTGGSNSITKGGYVMGKQIQWEASLTATKAKAKKEKKLILMDFYNNL